MNKTFIEHFHRMYGTEYKFIEPVFLVRSSRYVARCVDKYGLIRYRRVNG